jgi:hypothetical protein
VAWNLPTHSNRETKKLYIQAASMTMQAEFYDIMEEPPGRGSKVVGSLAHERVGRINSVSSPQMWVSLTEKQVILHHAMRSRASQIAMRAWRCPSWNLGRGEARHGST